ncbi:hypothetical protein DFH06DRAFT_748779 [Mycena polygramma]|nr:hypothetical protein DFH06DRAFT_748779 [Mycena polygramma]
METTSPLLHPETVRGIAWGPLKGGGDDANQSLDPELLRGVSLGFVVPIISPELRPMPNTMPNIIALPYGRCPPVHLQAPTWRQLLELLARLSRTRIDASAEAVESTWPSPLYLRTVVQFVRADHPSADWRAILWLTIDYPAPASAPDAIDVDVLPLSYGLSSPPALLRDGSNTTFSKFYTIPPSVAVPLPTLPMTFPDIGQYLQAALEESRTHMGVSSRLGKLAEMVQACFPNAEVNNSNQM